ncbi:MAG: sigma 54-interacting transcriptional regulator [Sandaracinus sp.]
MGDPSTVSALARALRGAKSFDEGCRIAVDALAAVAGPALGAQALARGVVHLRSDRGAYRALVVRELTRGGHAAIAPSATVFSAIERAGGGVAVDLATCRGVSLAARAPVEVAAAFQAHDATGSIGQMLDRETTHLVALPLRAAGPLAGMLCLELAWPTHVGLPWPSGTWSAELEALADVAGPLLIALPLEEPTSKDDESLLPVIGQRTRSLVRVLSVFATQDETLLLSGPTGAGKSRLAQVCHARSPRHARAFETANLLAVPETIQMAELFGWRKGAFTGAHADHEGLIARAEGGTLFLDEIDKLSPTAQAGLLRVLETRRYAPLGATKERQANVRFIVATNADLAERVRAGAFREDLYYRINVLPLRVPSLDERRDEIAGWARAMLARRQEGTGTRASFDEEALALLAERRWPGNLRQLDNVVRRAFALAIAGEGDGSRVGVEPVRAALAFETASPGPGSAGAPRSALEAVALAIVERALADRRAGRTLALDAVDVLSGAVLRAAIERVGNLKDAYLLFGADALVENRNHTKHFKRVTLALDALLAALDEKQ